MLPRLQVLQFRLLYCSHLFDLLLTSAAPPLPRPPALPRPHAGATYYGLDGWSIHKGACGLGYQYKNQGTGWDVAAIADASPEFAGSCGWVRVGRFGAVWRLQLDPASALAKRVLSSAVQIEPSSPSLMPPTHSPSLPFTPPVRCRRCYEVRCDPRSVVTDGYGNSFDRSGVCKHPGATVVVRTVDNCERGQSVQLWLCRVRLPNWVCRAALLQFASVPNQPALTTASMPTPYTLPAGPCNYPGNAYSNKRW